MESKEIALEGKKADWQGKRWVWVAVMVFLLVLGGWSLRVRLVSRFGQAGGGSREAEKGDVPGVGVGSRGAGEVGKMGGKGGDLLDLGVGGTGDMDEGTGESGESQEGLEPVVVPETGEEIQVSL